MNQAEVTWEKSLYLQEAFIVLPDEELSHIHTSALPKCLAYLFEDCIFLGFILSIMEFFHTTMLCSSCPVKEIRLKSFNIKGQFRQAYPNNDVNHANAFSGRIITVCKKLQ